MDETKLLNPIKEKEYSMFKQLLVYTVLFVCTAVGVYFFFIIAGRTLLRSGNGNMDGIAQAYPTFVACKHLVHNFLTGGGWDAWNWSIGLGGDNLNALASKLTNPITYIIIAFPEKYLDIGYTVGTILRQYLTGVAFIFMGRKMGLNQVQRMTGAICYAFSTWVFQTAVSQGGFNNAAILFPLLILGTEKILRKESPIVFILSVFFLFSAGITWAYISGIVIVAYYFVRYFCAYYIKGDWKSFWKTSGAFIAYGFIGIMLSAFMVVSAIYTLSEATTDTGAGKEGWLFSLRTYITMSTGFFKVYESGSDSYSCLATPVLCMMLMPLAVLKIKKKSVASIFAVVLFLFSLTPISGRLFNAGSYASGRWYFVLVLFIIWAAMEAYTVETFRSWKKCIVMLVWIGLLAGWSIFRSLFMDLGTKTTIATAFCGLVFCIATIVIMRWHGRDEQASLDLISKKNAVIAVLVMLLVMTNAVEIANMKIYPANRDFITGFNKAGSIYKKLEKSCEHVAPELQLEDSSFFRTDQLGGYKHRNNTGAHINENIIFGNRSIYIYLSTMSSKWHKFNKAMGNNSGYCRRTISNSNDNRAALDYMMGVKYFLGNSRRSNFNSSAYVPYGYTKYKDMDKVEVFRNKYCMGLGTVYNQYITESELEAYPALAREQVLMQAAVVPDDAVVQGVKHAKASDIKTDVYKVGYTINVADKTSDLDLKAGKLTVRNNEGKFKLNIENAENCQLIVSFENLRRAKNSYDDEEELSGKFDNDAKLASIKEAIERSSYTDDQTFNINAVKDDVKKSAVCENGTVRGFGDVTDFNINMGYYDSIDGTIDISFNRSGYYTFDNICVYAMPMTIYEDNAKILDANSYNIQQFDNDYVVGTIKAKSDGIMYFSILSNPGWKIYVDGEKVEKINDVNIAFTGAMISAGEHQVELKYNMPQSQLILVLTIAGLILFVGAIVVNTRRNRYEHKS